MLGKIIRDNLAAAVLILAGTLTAQGQSIDRDYDNGYDHARIDRYLDAEIWTDHYDGEYYEGNNVVIYFRVSRDAFVSIYTIDTRGRVNLLFPADPGEDNFVRGGVTYSLPDAGDDLVVTGPEGFENLQIIASRERFSIPNWYHNSGLVCDWDDRNDYMDYLNDAHFVRYSGQRFAYDRAVIYVNEWERYYYRPVYYPYYPSWTIYGNCYIDYPYGATVYVNGVYWGCAPLYVPRITVGWHVITIYDHRGYCWESDFHVSRYNTVVFSKTVINVNPTTKSKYREVRAAGYRNPVEHGYPKFKAVAAAGNKTYVKESGAISNSKRTQTTTLEKKYVRGSTKLVKTDRGYETDGLTAVFTSKKRSSRIGHTSRIQGTTSGSSVSKSSRQSSSAVDDGSSKKKGSSGDQVTRSSGSQKKKSSSSDYYQKKSGSSGKTKSAVGSSSTRVPSRSGISVQRKSGGQSGKTKSRAGNVQQRSDTRKPSGTLESTVRKSTTKSSGDSGSSGNKVKSSSTKKSGGAAKTSDNGSSKKKSNSGSRSRR